MSVNFRDTDPAMRYPSHIGWVVTMELQCQRHIIVEEWAYLQADGH